MPPKRTRRPEKKVNYERQAEEARLMYEDRLSGMSLRAIAKKHGYSLRTIQKRLHTHIPKILDGPANEYRFTEVEKLDELEEKLWAIIRKDHSLVSHGKVMYAEDPQTGQEIPLKDYAPVMQAINQLKWIAERRSKLLGLDQPTKAEVTVTSGEPEDAELSSMIQRAREKAASVEEVLQAPAEIESQNQDVVEAEIVDE